MDKNYRGAKNVQGGGAPKKWRAKQKVAKKNGSRQELRVQRRAQNFRQQGVPKANITPLNWTMILAFIFPATIKYTHGEFSAVYSITVD